MEAHSITGCMRRLADKIEKNEAEIDLLKWIITKLAEDVMRDEFGKDRRNNELLTAIWDGRFDVAVTIRQEELE